MSISPPALSGCMKTGLVVLMPLFASVSHDALQQEQILRGLRYPEVLAAQRHRGGEHHLWRPFQ